MNDTKSKKQNEMDNKKLKEILSQPWRKKSERLLSALNVSPNEGLEPFQIQKYRKVFGSNEFQKSEKKSTWKILLNQFKNFLIAILVVAAVVSFLFQEYVDGISIIFVILINTIIGFYTELRANRSMEALSEMTKTKSKVRRGEIIKINADELVVGDIIVFEEGDLIPADARVLKSENLQLNESPLTGESVPIDKIEKKIEGDIPLAERNNMIYKGTGITRGSGEALVVSTGIDTELGKISSLVESVREGETPLTKRLSVLARKLFIITIVIAVIVAFVGILRGKEFFIMIETSIALAVAAVPEGLPIVATIALARGMWRMAEKNALINKLSAVEALGSTNIICADKTGTLTENRMTATKIIIQDTHIEITGTGLKKEGDFIDREKKVDPKENVLLNKILKVGVLCNNAFIPKEGEIDSSKFIGNPMEIALLIMGAKAGIWREELLEEYKEEKEFSFDYNKKMMATYNKSNGNYLASVKGAPEQVLKASTSIQTLDSIENLNERLQEKILEENESLAKEGLRILAFAFKEINSLDEDPYKDLIFLGLIAFLDPPREEVKPVINKVLNAGIKIVMITGDQAPTAKKIGIKLGIVEDNDIDIITGNDLEDLENLNEDQPTKILNANIFARVTPEQKLQLIDVYQEANNVVAMTGDGVNDAPALRKANIGVAMGIRGTQVAQEASDMVLQDDDFGSIANAVEEGRTIANNIRKFVIYLLSCNISEILLILLASIFNLPLPITPLQILYLNIVTDVFPALALAVGESTPDIMSNPPRAPDEPIIHRTHWILISLYGFILTMTVLMSFLISLSINEIDYVTTISFLTLAFTQLWHVFNMRNKGSKFLKNEITLNKYVWGAIILTFILLIIPVYLPFISDILGIVDPGIVGWIFIMGMSFIPFIIGQLWNSLRK